MPRPVDCSDRKIGVETEHESERKDLFVIRHKWVTVGVSYRLSKLQRAMRIL